MYNAAYEALLRSDREGISVLFLLLMFFYETGREEI